MKFSTRMELFPCSEVIGWILPKADTIKMILSNVVGQGFVAYSPTYVAQAYNISTPQIYLTEKWLKEIDFNIVDSVQRMMVPEK